MGTTNRNFVYQIINKNKLIYIYCLSEYLIFLKYYLWLHNFKNTFKVILLILGIGKINLMSATLNSILLTDIYTNTRSMTSLRKVTK